MTARTFGSAFAALLMTLWTLALGAAPAGAAAGFDSSYRFESAFLSGLQPGQTGQLSVFFDNTGTSAWVTGTPTQVNLIACRADKSTCGASDKASWNPGGWV